MRDWASKLRAIADGRLMLNVRNGVTVSRSMLAMIADEIDALRAAPLTPAEAGGLVERLRGIPVKWIDLRIGEEAADAIEALSAALTAERAAHAETQRMWEQACAMGAMQKDRLAEALEALDELIELNDSHSPFGGELYQDRIDRTWEAARRALGGKKDG